MAASAANLLLIPVWARIFSSAQRLPETAMVTTGVAALLNLALLTAVFAAVTVGSALRPVRPLVFLARAIPVASVLLAINALRQLLAADRPLGDLITHQGVGVGLGIAAVLAAVAASRWPMVWRLGRLGVVVLGPLVPFVAVSVGWGTVSAVASAPTPAPRVAHEPPAARVLWLIFDEMDQQVAFGARPRTLSLPAFDRLLGESFVATHAVPPSQVRTILSMAALMEGRLVEEAVWTGPADFEIKFRGTTRSARWSEQPNVFSRARAAGVDSGLVGWYIPYCRIFQPHLRRCTWMPFGQNIDPPGLGVPSTMRHQLFSALTSVPFAYRWLPSLQDEHRHRESHIALYRQVVAAARDLATDAELGLVLAHMPVPHLPAIYNRFHHAFTSAGDGTYLDNLVLADHALAEIRSAMERAGTWSDTAILISADHSWRITYGHGARIDPRVPFILKLPGRPAAAIYRHAFNTVVTHDILLALLARQLRTTADVARWLDHQITTKPEATAPAAGPAAKTRARPLQ